LKLFSVLEEKSPELVWNDETREELNNILEQQIRTLEGGGNYFELVEKFEYSVNKRELRVKNIFVRHFNTSLDFKFQDVNEFA